MTRQALHPLPKIADDLYTELDQLHGQVLRAKYRMTENQDDEVLADLVADIQWLAKRVEQAWQAYDAERNQ